jgi:multimeric flavodoxin WrbA
MADMTSADIAFVTSGGEPVDQPVNQPDGRSGGQPVDQPDDKSGGQPDGKPDILFISGSPRDRTCVALIDFIEQGARHAGAKTQRFLLSKKHINPCVGCGGCNTTGACAFAGKTRDGHFTDDYLELKAVLERVDAIAIVAPLYFAGPPAQLKALYDRMQPYWVQRYLLGHGVAEKRPAQLFVVGGGGDAHGHAPLVGSTKSAMAVAGFSLEKVNNFIGFSAPSDVPAFPRDDEVERYSNTQLAQLKRFAVRQKDLEQRAIDAGGAFARFVVKKKQANDLAEQLAQVEAELEALRRIGDAERSEQTTVAPSSVVRGVAMDRKGDLQAEIDLEYSNLISRTPRNGEGAQRGDAVAPGDAAAEQLEVGLPDEAEQLEDVGLPDEVVSLEDTELPGGAMAEARLSDEAVSLEDVGLSDTADSLNAADAGPSSGTVAAADSPRPVKAIENERALELPGLFDGTFDNVNHSNNPDVTV